MATTTNYGLYVEDDATTKVKTWREKMNGTGNDSNMVIIDRVLGEKADASVEVNATLDADGWEENDGVFEQTIAVTDLTATQNGSIGLSQSATAEEREAACDAALTVSGQTDGYLTVAVSGVCPTIDIPVTIILLG